MQLKLSFLILAPKTRPLKQRPPILRPFILRPLNPPQGDFEGFEFTNFSFSFLSPPAGDAWEHLSRWGRDFRGTIITPFRFLSMLYRALPLLFSSHHYG
jgi:hypothetical protein